MKAATIVPRTEQERKIEPRYRIQQDHPIRFDPAHQSLTSVFLVFLSFRSTVSGHCKPAANSDGSSEIKSTLPGRDMAASKCSQTSHLGGSRGIKVCGLPKEGSDEGEQHCADHGLLLE